MQIDRGVLVDARYRGQIFQRCQRDFLDGQKSGIQQAGGGLLLDARETTQFLGRGFHAFHVRFDLGLLFRFALDVQVPADQFSRQTHVLAALADGQRKLVFRDDHFHHGIIVGLRRDAVDYRRVQRVAHVVVGIVVVLHDVDLLSAQFTDHSLNTRALHAHARSDGVDVAILRTHGNLAALAGIAGDADYAHRAVVDLRHFHLEQLLDQQFAGSGEQQLRALALAFDVDQYHADAVAGVVVFGARLLAAQDDTFGAPQVDDHVATVETLGLAGEQLSDPVAVLPPDHLALCFLDLLIDHLLGGLSRDAGQRGVEIVDRGLDHLSELGVFTEGLGFLDRDLGARIGQVVLFDNDLLCEHREPAGRTVEPRAVLFLGVVVLPGRSGVGLFQCIDDDLGVQAFLSADGLDGVQQFASHDPVTS